MLFDKIKEYLLEFPQLQEEYNKLVSEGYKTYHIAINASHIGHFLSDRIEILMENGNGCRILLNQYRFDDKKFSRVYKEIISNNKQKIHSDIKLTEVEVNNKEFSKSILRGYNCDEVDCFLDTIAEDYKRVRELLSRD